MRKFMKKSILEIIRTMYEAHRNIKQFIEMKNFENANIILGDCQDAAVQIGTAIESSEGEGFVTIGFLEEYCEAVYEVAVSISDAYNGKKAQKHLDKILIKVENSVKNDIKVRLEIVFCPYKASMWDSLESVWKAADEDHDCDAYVVPIPYYDRNPDHSFGEFHYEGGDYPDYVPITHYEAYNFEARRPDVVYIHNPYDECNYVTSVDPRFYSSELKKYTERLVYVPYYVLHSSRSKELLITNAFFYADDVIVQNENVRKWYFEMYKDKLPKELMNKKISVLGSPKIDKMVSVINGEMTYPDTWVKHINGRKVIFFNTNVSLILKKSNFFIGDLDKIFNVFFKYKDKWVVLWREHPLSMSTIKSMRPEMINEYNNLKKKFLEMNIGFFDTTPDPYPAMKISDCYYGAGGSMLVVYGVTGKPALITNYKKYEDISDEEIDITAFMVSLDGNFFYRERNRNALDVFMSGFDKLEEQKNARLNAVKEYVTDMNGTVGKNIHSSIKHRV